MITVLVVDDDFRVARIHATFVDRVEGFKTVGATGSGQEALELARRLRPNLILLDLYLPDMFGLDLLNQLRVAGFEGDTIAITAANEAQTVERALKLGVSNYLLKPFTYEDLLARLAEYRTAHARPAHGPVEDQAEVDRIFARVPGTRGTALPKGLSPQTAALILGALSAEPQSAQECAQRAGISRVSARRYLEFFVAHGKAHVALRYGSPGRPERRYTRAPVAD